MANVDSPFGLRPVDHLLGLDWSAKVRKVYFDSGDGTAAYIGDPIILAAAGSDPTRCYPSVLVATVGATNAIYGVIVGFEPDPADLTLKYRKASTARYAYAVMDPYVIYEIQSDTAGGAIAQASVGLNSVLINTGGDTSTGLSAKELNAGVLAADATYQLSLLGGVDRPDNDTSLVHAKWRVLINLHGYRAVYDAHASAWYGSLGV